MGWTSPRTFVTGEIETATIFNTHLRDNLIYLKGGAGTIAFDAGATFNGALVAAGLTSTLGLAASKAGASVIHFSHSSNSFETYLGQNTTGTTLFDANRSVDTGTFDDPAKSHAAIRMDASGTASNIQLHTANAANTTATERMRIVGDGKIGMGITTPTGPLHVSGAIASWVFFEFDALAGVAKTVLATSSALYAMAGFAICRPSNGATAVVTSLGAAPLTSFNIYSVGGDTCQLTLASGGFTVVRTAGALTYKVAIFLLCI